MLRNERYEYILNHFRDALPHVTTELQFGSAFQLLVATLLSAQCTDKRINMVTPALFARYPDARHMAQASEEDIFELISSVSYPNAKAKHLAQMSRQLVELFGGEVPEATDDLVKLAGVGRKTANVIRAVWFGHACLSREPSHGLGAPHGRYASQGRGLSDETYSCRGYPESASLDTVAWQVCMQECQTAL